MFRAPKPSKESKQKPQSFPLNMSNRLQHGRIETTLIHAYMCMCTEGESMFKHGGEILFLWREREQKITKSIDKHSKEC